MGALLLAAIAVIGYLFSKDHYPTSYKLARSEGWLTYFAVLVHGIFIFLVVSFVLALADALNLLRPLALQLHITTAKVQELGLSYFEFKIWLDVAVSLVLAWILGKIFRRYYSEKKINELQGRQQPVDILESMALRVVSELNSLDDDVPYLMVTTITGKVYVGVCNLPDVEQRQPEFIVITPFLSGYRDDKDKRVTFTVNYNLHYKLDPRFAAQPAAVFADYKIYIPRERIDFLSIFHLSAYLRFSNAVPGHAANRPAATTKPRTKAPPKTEAGAPA